MEEAQREASVLVCETVAESLEQPMETLPPLSNAIKPDALDSIVSEDSTHDVTVTFAYAGMRVLVNSGHTVYVQPLRDGCTNPRDSHV